MPEFRRRRVPGGTFFFTVRLQDRNSDLLIREVDRLRRATRATLARKPFQIDDIVILPSVIHTIWTLPEGDADFSNRWGMLRAVFSRGLPAPADRHPAALRRQEKGIWQRRFWEHHLRDADDIAAHRHMIYAAPVQAGLVARPSDWQWSSIHRAARAGTWNRAQAYGTSAALSPRMPRVQAQAEEHMLQT